MHGAWSITLTRDPAAGWQARQWLTEAIGPRCNIVARGPGALEEILVMASELIANVVLHTEDNPEMAVRADADAIHVAVSDGDPRIPEMAPLAPSRVGGNGLRIVDALSD
ncbi:MAG: ATP-binding protein, partial [Acidimicrobiales bacterium]